MPRQRTGNKNGRPNKSGLNARQLRAAKLDYPHINWGVFIAMETQRKARERISRLPAKQLAKKVGVEERIIQHWRAKDPFYRSQLKEWFLEKWLKANEDRDPPDYVDPANLAEAKDRMRRMEEIVTDMDRYLGKDWPVEGVKSPIDDKVYATPLCLAIHLQEHNCVPAEMVKERIGPLSPLPLYCTKAPSESGTIDNAWRPIVKVPKDRVPEPANRPTASKPVKDKK